MRRLLIVLAVLLALVIVAIASMGPISAFDVVPGSAFGMVWNELRHKEKR
jgi:uncharacterized membrane protein YdjX (TVP38/TMEM64 family)